MVERTYKDNFTLDGRLKPVAGVSRAKVLHTKKLMEAAMQGDRIADATLRESVTTSDAVFNAAYLTTLNLIPQFDAAERSWADVATVRTAPDFRPVQLYSLYGDLNGPGITANGAAATVPEAAPYPHVTVSGNEGAYASMAKHGFKFSFTWEARINDTVGFFDGLPAEMLNVALDTEVAEVYDALINGTDDTRELAGGTLPDGTTVLPNAALTPAAIWQAIIEESNRTVNGRKIGRASGYNVIVPTGVKDFIDYQLNRTVLQVQDGNIVYGPGDTSALNNITTIESDRLTGTQWYLLPKPGTTRRPVLELLRLRGNEQPELRVNNATGNYIGGAAISPYEGSFNNDTIDFRFRYAVGSVLWDDIFVVKSAGTGVA